MGPHSRRLFIPVLRAFALPLLLAVSPGPAGAHPDLWHWMEERVPEPVRVSLESDADDAGAVLRIELPTGHVVLDLRRVHLTAAAAGPGDDAVFYRGIVRGGDGRGAAVSIAAGSLSAAFRVDGSLWMVDSAWPPGAAPGRLHRGDDPFAGPSRLRPRFEGGPSASPGTGAGLEAPYVLDIAAVADFEYFQKFGGGTTAQMLAVLNLVDQIYLDQVNVTLNVSYTKVFDESGDPFSDFNSANLFFNYRDATAEFGNYRDSTGGDLEAAGLAHLFSDRNLNVPPGAKINAGFGFIGVLCDADRGVSLSTAPTIDTSLHSIVVAHEFGHNFGAPHDSEGACAATPAGTYLMSPNVTGSEFSDCSKSIMIPSRDGASCIDQQTGTTTTSTTTSTTMPSALCGDATGDDKLLASDALRVLRVAVGQFECLLCICDADGSGSISAADALRVLRASVNQPVELACPAC